MTRRPKAPETPADSPSAAEWLEQAKTRTPAIPSAKAPMNGHANGHAKAQSEPIAPGPARWAAPVPEWDYLRMSDVVRKNIDWLWPDKLAYGKLSIVAGDGDKGKSWAMLDLAARLSTGTPFPGETERPAISSTVLLMGEDDPADTIGPRLDAQRADSKRIYLLRGVQRGQGTAVVRLQRDMDRVAAFLAHVEARLLVIDGMASYMGGTDGINEIEVRQVLMPLTDMAQRAGAAVVCIMHRNKGQHTNPLHAIAGSVAFGNVARCVLAVADDDQAPGRRVLVPIKGNIIRSQHGVGYRIQDFELHWDTDPVSLTKDTIFADRPPNAVGGEEVDDGSRLGQAKTFLRTALDRHDGRWPMRELLAEAVSADVGLKEKTIRRAKLELGIDEQLVYEDDGKHRWYWLLAAEDGNPV